MITYSSYLFKIDDREASICENTIELMGSELRIIKIGGAMDSNDLLGKSCSCVKPKILLSLVGSDCCYISIKFVT